MNKTKKLFYCKKCGAESPKWIGQCNSCKEWNTIVEEVIEKNNNWNVFNCIWRYLYFYP